MDSIRRLEEIFAHFPGIGPRQARRFVYYLLNKSPSFVKDFTDLVAEVKRSTSECDRCHRIFMHNNNSVRSGEFCSTCSDTSRDQSILMVVARDSDYESIEKSGAYRGLYFILGGTVPVLDKEPEKRIRLKKLLERVTGAQNVSARTTDPRGTSEIKEIVLSLSTTPDGEHTANIVGDALKPPLYSGKVTVLGRGLSTGAELEYADSETIRSALINRH